ncbi:TPA: hypothetical protein ACH0TI_004073, partial [Escherichia coli]
VTLKMPAFEWVHVQLHQQKGMISLSPPTICNSAKFITTDYLQQCPLLFGIGIVCSILLIFLIFSFLTGGSLV